MSFWQSFRDGYREARGSAPPPEYAMREPPPPEPPGECEECERQAAAIEERDAEIAELRHTAAESATVIAELTSQVERLTAAHKEKRRAEPSAAKGDDAKYKKLCIAVAKHFHPDTAPMNEPLAAELERRFKAVRAEIDRIDAG
jgi:hypothetical protein